jgi:branched-chain amino acid aminotransferase
MTQHWCNGRWLEFPEFPGSPLDRGSILGLGLFETLLGLEGAPVFAARHFARLKNGMDRLGWEFPQDDLGGIAEEILERNQLATGRARIRLAVTAGSGPLDRLACGADRMVWMAAFPAAPTPDGVSVMLSPWLRNQNSPLAGLKCASYAENLIALDHARGRGFQETIFLNTERQVCEAATANVFVVKNGGIFTPPLESGCLPGIAREVIVSIAARDGLPLEERTLELSDLRAADEIFLTSATRGPVAVSRFEETLLAAGPVTAGLMERWAAELAAEAFHRKAWRSPNRPI